MCVWSMWEGVMAKGQLASALSTFMSQASRDTWPREGWGKLFPSSPYLLLPHSGGKIFMDIIFAHWQDSWDFWRSFVHICKYTLLSVLAWLKRIPFFLHACLLAGTIIPPAVVWHSRYEGSHVNYPTAHEARKILTHTLTLTHSLTHLHTHSFTHTLTHSLIHTHTHSHTHSLIHLLMHSITHSHTHTHTHTHSFKYIHVRTCIYMYMYM